MMPTWGKRIAGIVTFAFVALLVACGDVGVPGPDGSAITPQSFAASAQVLAGSSQDFSGSGKSAILWRNSNGQAAIWLMNGMAQSSSAIVATVSTDWTIAGTGDFDGDGKSDILWRNSNGQLAIWLMNGMTQKSGAIVATVSTDWTIAGTGDFDGDGKSDILWRNSNGQLAIWLMNGMAQKSSAIVATVSTDWTTAGTGDFDGDGRSDILWRNNNGQLATWLMNGMAQKSSAIIATVSTDWTIAGTGDFDVDGKSDILWRNSNGQVAIWLMNGTAQKSSAVIAAVGTDWTIAGTGDFDGDGRSDILWRNSNGQTAIWLMNGTAQKSSAVIATVGIDWTIANAKAAANGSTPSSASSAPSAPSALSATAGNSQATISFAAPANNGGSAITQYRVTASPGGISATGTGSPITITGLSNGALYTFTVTATNASGTSAASAPSNGVVPSSPPATGGGGGGGSGGGSGYVTWTNSSNGSTIKDAANSNFAVDASTRAVVALASNTILTGLTVDSSANVIYSGSIIGSVSLATSTTGTQIAVFDCTGGSSYMTITMTSTWTYSCGSGSGGAGGGSSGSNASFSINETSEINHTLTGASPNYASSSSITLAATTRVWAFSWAQYTASFWAVDAANAQSLRSGGSFTGYRLLPSGQSGFSYVTLPAGTWYVGVIPAQSVSSSYSNQVYAELSSVTLPGATEVANYPASTGAVNPGAWNTTPFAITAGYRYYIETEGPSGTFLVMTAAQANDFTSTYSRGYFGGTVAYTYACGSSSGGAFDSVEIECEMKLTPGNYALVYINTTSGTSGGVGQIAAFQ